MATSARTARSPAKSAKSAKSAKKPTPGAAAVRLKAAAAKRAKKSGAKKSATSIAIATELAPAVAIALLEKTEQEPGSPAAALDCLAAGAMASETEGKVRVQLMFENGAVLPVEMSEAAGAALSKGLAAELPKKK